VGISKTDIELNYNFWFGISKMLTRDSDTAYELLHDTLLRIIEKERSIDNPRNYVANSLRIAWYSQRSPFNYDYRDFQKRMVELTEDMDCTMRQPDLSSRIINEQLDIYISRLPFFEREVFYLYALNDFSYDKLSKETTIPKIVLYRAVKRAKLILRNSIKII
jgi:DNA-directed RNA polymerase specialized sigma24 family protein